jgi:lipopolysaccharide export LptBFGC system permease protein LptF
MIFRLLFLVMLLFAIGCSDLINESELQSKRGLLYNPKNSKPYSGKVYKLYSTGSKMREGVFDLGAIEKNINLRLKDKESSIENLKDEIEKQKKRKNLKKVRYLKMEIYKRFSFPFTCIIFVFLAMPFALINIKNPKSWSIFILILVIFCYYMILIMATAFVKKGILSPLIGAWLPNIIFTIIAMILFHLLNREKWIF